ncbi:hypothetical protein [Agromyces silvae]|uniref:hypothetical protein n=1 Tax=Agromyces silvae TaxID=3388266 RepID=UPI00280B596D|nr:hypothetical protein [Agromyces protaetiae]
MTDSERGVVVELIETLKHRSGSASEQSSAFALCGGASQTSLESPSVRGVGFQFASRLDSRRAFPLFPALAGNGATTRSPQESEPPENENLVDVEIIAIYW